MKASLKDTGCQPQAHGQAEPGGGPCPRCSRPRCCASAKSRPGERCRRNPHPGATICDRHGLTEAGRAKAAAVVQEAEASRLLVKFWDKDAEPITNAVAALQRLAGSEAGTLDTLGELVNRWLDQDETCEACGRPASDPPAVLLTAFQRQERLHGRTLTAMEGLNLADRHLELEGARAEMVVAALTVAIGPLSLVPEQRAEVLRRFSDGLVVAGPAPLVLPPGGGEAA